MWRDKRPSANRLLSGVLHDHRRVIRIRNAVDDDDRALQTHVAVELRFSAGARHQE
jgi:hypothetical protein